MISSEILHYRRKRAFERNNSVFMPVLLISPDISTILNKYISENDFFRSLSKSIQTEVVLLKDKIADVETGYVRDKFQVFDDLVFTPGERGIPLVKKILGRKIRNKQVIVSDFGIGGKVLRSGNLIVATDDLRNLPEVNLLRSRGYEIEFLPIPSSKEQTILSERMDYNRHIDSEVNFVATNNGYVFVVNEEYYERYKDDVEALAKRHAGTVRIIQDLREQTKLRGVNFIEVNSKVMVPDNCTETIKILKDALDEDKVILVKVDCSKFNGEGVTIHKGEFLSLYFHGGLRCLTNIIF